MPSQIRLGPFQLHARDFTTLPPLPFVLLLRLLWLFFAVAHAEMNSRAIHSRGGNNAPVGGGVKAEGGVTPPVAVESEGNMENLIL